MIDIQNNQSCFVQLWLRLERTRLRFIRECKWFCIRRLLQEWYGETATDDYIWEVCNLIELDGEKQVCGYDLLPLPSLYPRKHREFLRALVAFELGIGIRKVDLEALDKAYSKVFPRSTPINVNKKKRA